MSMSHKAYVFDHDMFSAELAPLLYAALSDGCLESLQEFIERHHASLKDPFEGDPLPVSWASLFEARDPHSLGDIALTKFYEPAVDVGLGDAWIQLKSPLAEATLGHPFGPVGEQFDPGKMGSYFLDTRTVLERQGVHSLKALGMFEEAAALGKGLYITF